MLVPRIKSCWVVFKSFPFKTSAVFLLISWQLVKSLKNYFNPVFPAFVSFHCTFLILDYCLDTCVYKMENLISETLLWGRGKRVFQLPFFEECRQVPGQPQQVPPACQRLSHSLTQDDDDPLPFDPPHWVS